MLAFVTLASWEVTVTVWDCSLLYHTEICTHPRLCVGLFSRRFSCSCFCNTCVFQHLGTFVFIIIIRVCVICWGLTLSFTLLFVKQLPRVCSKSASVLHHHRLQHFISLCMSGVFCASPFDLWAVALIWVCFSACSALLTSFCVFTKICVV